MQLPWIFNLVDFLKSQVLGFVPLLDIVLQDDNVGVWVSIAEITPYLIG